MLNARNCYNEENFNKVFKIYDDAYNSNTTYKTEIYDGVKELLDNLKEDGIKLAVMSNKPDFATKSVVYEFFGKDYFDIVLGQRDNIPIKPDPYSVNEIIDELGVSKNEVIYVGDTATDMKTGKNAGLFSVGVLWGFRDEKELRENDADLIISHPDELFKYIKEL
jgi:phosphoglycolate phosphatase